MERTEESARRFASWWHRIDGPDAGVVAFWRGLHDGVSVVKAGVGEILDANDAMGQILGLSREALPGKCISAFRAPGEADPDAASAGRGGGAVESRWFHRDGRTLTLEVSRTPWRQSGIVVWICRDVTARKDRETAMQAGGERLHSLLNACPAVIYTCRASGDFGGTSVSNDLENLLGYRAADFVSDPRFWASHVHPEDRARGFSAVERLSGAESHTDGHRFLAEDGRYVWLRDQFRVIRDAQGRSNELPGFLVEVTARREAELALEASAKRHRELIAGVPG
ncbi:MAG: PAS domain-containing protein, partial [Verrucomicrobiales bacterium]|nr:PAS domain-containing protein [Verrucomicrobiales bacterium]